MTTGLLITTAGQNAIIADLGGGADLVLTHVAWGDANGVPYNPNAAQVALVNEKYRATIASVAVVAGAIVVDAVIPADTNDGTGRPSHGFNVAEVGLFSAAGTLIGLARCGNGYKPPPSSGQASAVTYRLKLAVANPSAITVTIDPTAQVNVGRHVRPFWVTVDGVLNDPPAAPAIGATYVINGAPTGAWVGQAYKLAQWVGVWVVTAVPTGHQVCDNSVAEDSTNRYLKRTATGWASAASSTSAYGLALMATPAEAVAAASTTKVPNVDGMSEALQAGRLIYAVAGGTANAWTVALNRAISAYATGRVLWIKAPATNTSTIVTINVSGVGNKPLKKGNGANPEIGDLIGGRWYPAIDDGAEFQVVALLPSDVLKDVPKAGRTQVFTASGTFTVPAGVYFVRVRVVGGGGAGGGAPGGTGVVGAGGAAAGGYAEKWCSVTPGQVITVTVGGGAVSAGAGFNGGAGGSSSFGAFCSASGGGGGAVNGNTNSIGGVGTGGDLNLYGSGGQQGTMQGTTPCGAPGGGPPFGGGSTSNSYGQGYDAQGYGAGGGGAGGTTQRGGNGAPGLVIVEW